MLWSLLLLNLLISPSLLFPCDTADPAQLEARLQAAYKRVETTFVCLSKDGRPLGGGVFIDPSGQVLTHGHHELPVQETLDVTVHDGRTIPGRIDATLLLPSMNVSIIVLEGEEEWPAVERTIVTPRSGEDVFMPGIPLKSPTDEGPLLRLGTVTSVMGPSVSTDVRISPGDSGSPLFDLQGRLIGVANHVTLGDDPTSFFAASRAVFERFDDFDRPIFSAIQGRIEWTSEDWPPLQQIGRSVVTLEIRRQPVALALVVREDGILVTKTSALGPKSSPAPFVVFQGRRLAAKKVGEIPAYDMTLLRVEGARWTPPQFVFELPVRGRLVAAPINGKRAIRGVITTGALRDVPLDPGHLGVELESDGTSVRVKAIPERRRPSSPLRLDDVIEAIDEEPVTSIEDVETCLGRGTKAAGTVLTLRVRRRGSPMTVSVPLRGDLDWQRDSEGDLSLRRTGFQDVVGHDTPLRSHECGGPLCDVEGRVLGWVVARKRRHESLMVPSEILMHVVEEALAIEKGK